MKRDIQQQQQVLCRVSAAAKDSAALCSQFDPLPLRDAPKKIAPPAGMKL